MCLTGARATTVATSREKKESTVLPIIHTLFVQKKQASKQSKKNSNILVKREVTGHLQQVKRRRTTEAVSYRSNHNT